MELCDRSDAIGELESLLSACSPEERVAMIESIRKVIDDQLARTQIDEYEMRCPVCGGTEFIRYGKTAAGTQRWQCRHCRTVKCFTGAGTIMANTKLSYDQWMRYAECFVDHLTSSKVCKRIGVCNKTAWFMRVRTLEALYDKLPAFQMKSGMGVEVDEIYFRESFKGTRFEGLENVPREPRHDKPDCKAGISDDQICVVTAFDDAGDFFYDVSCRGALTHDIALETLRGRICSGAIVNTDRHRAYGKVMKELGVAVHNAAKAREEACVSRLNKIHQDIRAFMTPFKGVSTKWLHLYLAWYKWLRTFADDAKIAIKQIVNGDSVHRWADIASMPIPFRDCGMNPLKRRSFLIAPPLRSRCGPEPFGWRRSAQTILSCAHS